MGNNLPFVNDSRRTAGTGLTNRPPPFSRLPITKPTRTHLSDATEDIPADKKIEHDEQLAAAKALVDKLQEGKGKDFKFTDLLMPAFLGGIAAATGSGGFGQRLRRGLTGAATFVGAKNKEANRLDQLDRQFNAAEKQRRFSRATVAIKGLVEKGLFDSAASLSVEMYNKMGIPTTKKDFMDKFVSDKWEADSDTAWTRYKRLLDSEMITEAKDFELENHKAMKGHDPTEEELEGMEERYTAFYKLRKFSQEKIDIEMETIRTRRDKLKLDRDLAQLKLEKLEAGESGTLQELNPVKKFILNAVYNKAARNLKPEEKLSFKEFQKENPGIEFAMLMWILSGTGDGDARGQKIRENISAEAYIESYNSILQENPKLLEWGSAGERRIMTIEEIFAGETDILTKLEELKTASAKETAEVEPPAVQLSEEDSIATAVQDTTTTKLPAEGILTLVDPPPGGSFIGPTQTAPGGFTRGQQGPSAQAPVPFTSANLQQDTTTTKPPAYNFDATKYTDPEAAQDILEAIRALREAAGDNPNAEQVARDDRLQERLNGLRIPETEGGTGGDGTAARRKREEDLHAQLNGLRIPETDHQYTDPEKAKEIINELLDLNKAAQDRPRREIEERDEKLLWQWNLLLPQQQLKKK